MDQWRRESGHVEVVRTGRDVVPVGHVEQCGQRVPAQGRVGAGGDEDPVENRDADQHDEQRGQQPPGAARPEGTQLDGAPLAPFDDQERGDEEARQREEAVEEEEPTRGQVDAGVHTQDAEHGDAPDSVECGQVGERGALARCVRRDACGHRPSVLSARGFQGFSRFPRPGHDPAPVESPAHCTKGAVDDVEQQALSDRAQSRYRPGRPGGAPRAGPVDPGDPAGGGRRHRVLVRRELPRRGEPDRSRHGGAHRRTPFRPVARPRRQRLRRAGVLRLGDCHRVQARLHAQ